MNILTRLISASCACAAALTLQAQGAYNSDISLYETSKPLIFKGFSGIDPNTPAIAVSHPLSYAELREIALHTASPDSMTLLEKHRRLRETAEHVRYSYMLSHSDRPLHLAWLLPEPPQLHQTPDNSREYLITDLPLPVDNGPAPTLLDDVDRINWLHAFDSGVQFSQAYLSPNWYQGGTNSLTLLVNFLWDVKINEVYHPSILFTNSVSYKLGLYSTPQDQYHSYGISQDLFQWNLKTGLRASNKWFYSFTLQFKTQFLHNYGENSQERKASFLSPGELNLGLGMTYATTGCKGRLKFNSSISPISYNLKTCIDKHIDPTLFSMPEGKKYYNQIGSNAELTAEWRLTDNIAWKSRLFVFTNYDKFQTDWENTFNFSINRFLSTQIYLHMRYDTASTATDKGWRYWMIKEILSFGFRYAFSTK